MTSLRTRLALQLWTALVLLFLFFPLALIMAYVVQDRTTPALS